MQGQRLSANVQTVTLLQQNASGEVTPVTLYKKGSKKRKTSGGLRVIVGPFQMYNADTIGDYIGEAPATTAAGDAAAPATTGG